MPLSYVEMSVICSNCGSFRLCSLFCFTDLCPLWVCESVVALSDSGCDVGT